MTQPQSSSEIKTDKLPEILPILPMIDAALFPKMVLPFLSYRNDPSNWWTKPCPGIGS